MSRVVPARPRPVMAPPPRPAVAAPRVVAPVASTIANDLRGRFKTAASQLAPMAVESAHTPQAQPLQAVPPVRSPLDMGLPGEDSPLRQVGKIEWRSYRRHLSRGLAMAMVLVILFGGLVFSETFLKLHKVFKGGTETAAALQKNVSPDLLKGEGRGRVNILLLGRGGGMHSAPDLTDTMMIASVDPVNHTVALLSLPRDLWVNVPNFGVMKLNAAWESGEFRYQGKVTPGSTDPKAIAAGYVAVDETVEQILGIDIDYNVLVDFQAFKQAVDTVGGVSLNVPADLVDPTMAWENGGNPVLAKAGPQIFDGTHALIYARSRETSSDYARAERQRALLVALKGKVVSMGTLSNPLKISKLMNAFGNNVQTDLSLGNANRLYGILKGVSDTKLSSFSLADAPTPYVAGGNVNGQSVVVPKAGLFNYAAIQQFVRMQLKDPYITKENAKIVVLNGSTLAGAAQTKAAELQTYGYNVVSTGNTPASGWNATTLVDVTHRNKYTKHYLEQRFNQTAADHLEDTTIPTNGADFVIIIGSNEAITPNN